jgi:hypothetical protein
MRQRCLVLSLAAMGLAMLMLAPTVHAQATRTWVSGVGNDANPCSRTAPCMTFAGAIAKTAAGGLIDVIDPGGFGAVTITKSITIDGYGAHAGILASGTNGVNINAAGINVALRNLSIEGVGTGLIGINAIQGASLVVENVKIFGFRSGTAQCLRVATTAAFRLFVKDSNLLDCGVGVHLQTTAGQLVATLDNVRIENMVANAFESTAGSVFLAMRRTTISNNGGHGVHAGSAASILNLEDNLLSFNNGTAVNAGVAGARIRISNNTIVNNSTGVAIAVGAFVESANNNRIDGNTATAPPNDTFTQQ